jgi:hypothetical protein
VVKQFTFCLCDAFAGRLHFDQRYTNYSHVQQTFRVCVGMIAWPQKKRRRGGGHGVCERPRKISPTRFGSSSCKNYFRTVECFATQS